MKCYILATAYLLGEIGADRLLETLKVCINYQSATGYSATLYNDGFLRKRQVVLRSLAIVFILGGPQSSATSKHWA